MEVKSEGLQQQQQVVRYGKIPVSSSSSMTPAVIERTRLKVWFVRICFSIVVWFFFFQLVVAFGELWRPQFFTTISYKLSHEQHVNHHHISLESSRSSPPPPPPPPPRVRLLPSRNYTINGFLRVTCNGGLNQMRAAICDMVTVARFLNLTLVVPELDKTSFWADTSDFEDIFDVQHFIDSLRSEVRIIKRLPKRYSWKYGFQPLVMQPISWSNEKYYFQQVLPLFEKHKVIHFNKTDARLANNGLPLEFQRLRCRVNFQALRFTPKIEALGHKLIRLLQAKGPFVALHLRYEMDMLAFSGCNHGCTEEEAEELKQMRYAYPWWRDKEINSEEKRAQGLCPLTPEETTLILQALGFDKNTQIYIASGEIYGSERRLASLRGAFPNTIKKDMLLVPDDLRQFRNHSSQMAALDFLVSVASNTFVPTYDGNMAKLVEGHRRYLGFKKSILLDRKKLVELVNLHQNGTVSWENFVAAVKEAHVNRTGQFIIRKVIPDRPKEEDYFYANPQECLCEDSNCSDLAASNTSVLHRVL